MSTMNIRDRAKELGINVVGKSNAALEDLVKAAESGTPPVPPATPQAPAPKKSNVVSLPIDVAPLITPVMMRRAGITGPNTERNRAVFDRRGRECNLRELSNGDLEVSVRGTNQAEEAARQKYHKLRLSVSSVGAKARQARSHYETTKANSTEDLAAMRRQSAIEAEAQYDALLAETKELETLHPVLLHDQLTSEIESLKSDLPRAEAAVTKAEKNLEAWMEKQAGLREPDDKVDAAIEASKTEIETCRGKVEKILAEIAEKEAQVPETGYTPMEPESYLVPFGSAVTFTP